MISSRVELKSLVSERSGEAQIYLPADNLLFDIAEQNEMLPHHPMSFGCQTRKSSLQT